MKKKQPIYILALLILSGESIFLLPFVLPRLFRPTYLDVFGMSNLELGTCYSVYGFVALASYFLGGFFADRFPPRKLMGIALLMTSLGGIITANYPSLLTMHLIYGYWGMTTILLFWAAMIKATRFWGGDNHQGKAFGFLEGGRGLVAAAIGSLGVFIFTLFLPEDVQSASMEERQASFSKVILAVSSLVAAVAILVWFWLKPEKQASQPIADKPQKNIFSNLLPVIRIPSVWLLMLIILCAYVGYKLTDDFALYAKEVMLYDEVKSAQIATWLFYIRPIVGITVGVLADRTRASLWILIGFILMFFGALIFATDWLQPGMFGFFFISLVAASLGIYAIRSLYFAVLQEGKIPLAVTGTAVGLISVIGYTPDIFVGPSMGYLLDSSPGALGHQHVFMMLAGFSFIGLLATIYFIKVTKRIKESTL